MSNSKKVRLSPFSALMRFIETKPAGDRFILRTLFFLIVASAVTSLAIFSISYSAGTPVRGGVLSEGLVGSPRFVNPILATTRVDQDTSAIFYRGLMKINNEGVLVPDIASDVNISEDGQTYNVVMRRDVRWHDNTPLTARDIAFTISLVQNADLKSPLRGNWSGVTVEIVGEYELNIILDEAYTPFIENFTLGILPRHIWSTLPIEQIPFSEINTNPVGSGPFRIHRINRNRSGIIESYELRRFNNYYEDVVLNGVTLRYYQNETQLLDAFRSGEIMSSIYVSTDNLKSFSTDKYQIISEPLPRIFAIFFNQNRSPAMRDLGARQALEAAINREQLINVTLNGFGEPITEPVPPYDHVLEASTNTDSPEDILINSGWTRNETNAWEKTIDGNTETLTVTIRTANLPLFQVAADEIANRWRDLGVSVQVDNFEQTDLSQSVIRLRDFQSLLFGIDMTRSVDLYPFWHSSQREDPGLNISQYANISVDALLRRARTSQDPEVIAEANREVIETISEDLPAIFLFSPTLIYVTEKDIRPSTMVRLSRPQERFMNINEWYLATDTVWPMFRD